MSRRLVCVVSVSKLKGGGGFPGKLCEDLAWLVTMQQDGGGGEEGSVGGGEQPLQLTSGWRLYPAGRLTGFPPGQDQVFWMRT